MTHRIWRSLTSVLKRHEWGTRTAQVRLTHAYREVFYGNPSREDQQIVLADLANAASWRKVFPPDVPSDVLRYHEGARSLFSRVFAFLSLSDSDVAALEQAARQEAIAEDQYVSLTD